MKVRHLAVSAVIAMAAVGGWHILPASAQATAPSTATAPAGPMGMTATGDLPAKTGSTTGVGQTKPPGDVVGDRLGTRPDLDRKSRDLDRKIDKGICAGCK